jgi:ElaB/YqjD/DUF883 family membrane-anchored ribosome-binding protein
MSTLYKSPEEVPSVELIARLRELGSTVTKGPEAVRREFNMRIPAEVDHDARAEAAEKERDDFAGHMGEQVSALMARAEGAESALAQSEQHNGHEVSNLRSLLSDALSIVRRHVPYTSSPAWEDVRTLIMHADGVLSDQPAAPVVGHVTFATALPVEGKREAAKALSDLRAVLCDPEGRCCIDGSHGDRVVVEAALSALSAAIGGEAQPEGNGPHDTGAAIHGQGGY